MGSTTFQSCEPGKEGESGEGDTTGSPIPARDGRRNWPTLVIEAGDTESLGRLRIDMHWWFNASQHQVKIVLLLKLDRHRHKIILEKWEERPILARPGAMTTRAAAQLEPTLQQGIHIDRNEATNPISYVTRDALVLDFQLLFLRPPVAGEHDIIFSVEELEEYAEKIWEVACFGAQ